jgi:tetratricopeptide (TPR) repeat protein
MVDLLLADVGSAQVTLSVRQNGEVTAVCPPFPFGSPISAEEAEDLRWYLEDYLRRPFGLHRARAQGIERGLAELGRKLFDALFGSAGTTVRAAEWEVLIRTADEAVLGLPWELLCDPASTIPSVHGVTRCLPDAELDTLTVPGDTLRVLLVIARPAGTSDVRYRSIAKPLLERIGLLSGRVELTVLRPPTPEALEQYLNAAQDQGRPFGVVHFDVHGDLAEEGTLLLERPLGGPHRVSASHIAAVVSAARVPVVVLNSCESGVVARRGELATATRLSQQGVPVVVAMGYRVNVVAAAEFMVAFYQRLFAGDDVVVAVRGGRRRLAEHDHRPGPSDPIELSDWMVPVCYLRREVRFPALGVEPRGTVATRDVSSLVGRDDMFLLLDAAARRHRVILLHGMGGIGKTALALAFGSWWAETGGVDDRRWVVETSFPRGYDELLDQIADQVPGAEFAAEPACQRRAEAEKTLLDRRLLVILDGLDSAWPEPEERKLVVLAGKLAQAGQSMLLITSRSAEAGLGDVRRIRVPGLASDEVREYVTRLRHGVPTTSDHDVVVRALNGHPRALREIVPLLEQHESWLWMESLHGEGLREEHLIPDALIEDATYSTRRLPRAVVRPLVAACLIRRVVDVKVLARLSQADPSLERFVDLDAAGWTRVLDQAAEVGLLEPIGDGKYTKHPVLSALLATRWRSEATEDSYQAERATAIRAMTNGDASSGMQRLLAGDEVSFTYALIDDPTLLIGTKQGLRFVRDTLLWANASMEVRPLAEFFERIGLGADVRRIRERVLADLAKAQLIVHLPPLSDKPTGLAWLLVSARWYVPDPDEVAEFERACDAVLRLVEREPRSPKRQRRLLALHSELARLSQKRNQFTAAETHARQALAIIDLPDTWAEPETVFQVSWPLSDVIDEDEQLAARADALRELSWINLRQDRLDAATLYGEQALAVHEERGAPDGLAGTLADLGHVALSEGDLAKARSRFVRAIAHYSEYDSPYGLAFCYDNMAFIAERQHRYADAEEWYWRARIIHEEHDDTAEIAWNDTDLGNVTRLRGRLADAEVWYHRAFNAFRALGDELGMAKAYWGLGSVAFDRGELDSARVWFEDAAYVFGELGIQEMVKECQAELARIAGLNGPPAR